MSAQVDPAPISADDLKVLKESIGEVLADSCDSLAVHAFVDGNRDLGSEIWRESAGLGWLGIGLAEDQGGLGFGAQGTSLLHVELGRVLAPGAFIPTLVVSDILAAYADPTCSAMWLPSLISGETAAAIPARCGDTDVRIDGNGMLLGTVMLLGATDSSLALVPVGTDRLAIIELAGTRTTLFQVWDPTRTLFEVTLDGLVPVATLADGGAAVRALTRAISIAVAADSIGLSHGVTAKTIAYLKERNQFGRPIGSFQALKHRIVDMVARVGIAEHLLAQAIESADLTDEVADLWAAMAKAMASDTAVFVAGDCTQLFGGVGFTWEYDTHLYLKRARLNEMLVGDNRALRDGASRDLARLTRAGRSSLDLPKQ